MQNKFDRLLRNTPELLVMLAILVAITQALSTPTNLWGVVRSGGYGAGEAVYMAVLSLGNSLMQPAFLLGLAAICYFLCKNGNQN